MGRFMLMRRGRGGIGVDGGRRELEMRMMSGWVVLG